MGPLPPIDRGEAITADWLNRLRQRAELANRTRGAGGTTVHVATTGVRTKTPLPLKVMPFEVYDVLTYPAVATLAPYTEEAKALYLTPSAAANEYGAISTRTSTLYYPLALRDSNGDYIGLPKLRAGMIVYAVFNKQSGRWEIMSPPQTWYRAVLDAVLNQGSSASTTISGTSVQVTVYDEYLGSGESIDSGKKVKVEWSEDDGKWYATAAEC